ncbi:glycyl-radical enzyme activating protein [Desulfococcaceae bacterium HSG7]|nr:glycyl-radical enzyme activating protein [Desulfococcaceae bacterium HSG7]
MSDIHREGIVFNIQKYSLHDGEGIRTIIFLKGCSMLCVWCSNPESQEVLPQLGYNPAKCLTVNECSRCRDICPENALTAGNDGIISVDMALCTNCLKCTDACPIHALNTYGYVITVEEILNQVQEDSLFYSRSGGGMTLSGGEPLFQGQFAICLLREARKQYIDTCIETCGNIAWSVLDEAADYLNYIYYDIKLMDSEMHRKITGFDNTLIKKNFYRLIKHHPGLPITVRTPIIPGFNDTEQEIDKIIDFIKGDSDVKYELLAYHRMGTPKYEYLGRDYSLGDLRELSQDRFTELSAFAKSRMNQ